MTNLPSAGAISFTPRRIRCISISIRSSPQEAFAETVVSGDNPISLLIPFVISKIKAAEHTFGYYSLM